jgi:peptide/nickel transport system substrate-binding protein
MNKGWIRSSTGLAALSLLLSLCTFAGGGETSASAASKAVKNSNLSVAVDLSDLVTLDPARNSANAGYFFLPLEGNTLLTVNPKNPTQLMPDLATSWGCNASSTVCTAKLRHGVRFSNGDPFTSADVVYSLERLKNINGGPAYLASTLRQAVATSRYVVTFKLNTSDSAFLPKLTTAAFIILDSKRLAAHGANDGPHAATLDKAENFLNTETMGTGPYMLKQWVPTTKLVFVQNPYYWGPKPHFKEVTLLDVPSTTTQTQLLQGGEVDIALNIDPTTATSLKSNANLVVQESPSLNLIMLCLDNSFPGLKNVNVRRAIAYAIDYNGIVKNLGGNAERPAATVPLGLQGANSITPYQTDLTKAKALMKAAGVKNLTVTAEFANNVPYGISDTDLWVLLKQDLAKIGITVSLKPVDYNTWVNDLIASKETATTGIWSPDYMDSADYFGVFGTTGSSNGALFHMNIPGSAAIFKKYLASSNTSIRGAYANKLVAMMKMDATFIPLIQPNNIFVYSKAVTGLEYVPNQLLNISAVRPS